VIPVPVVAEVHRGGLRLLLDTQLDSARVVTNQVSAQGAVAADASGLVADPVDGTR
jgi:hypothetical protein